MSFDLWLVFGLGLLCGLLLGSPKFRLKFFTSLRKFLAGLSKGAKDFNDKYKNGDLRK